MDELLGCDHKNRSFVQSGTGSDGRHSVYICETCGEIIIHTFRDGVSFTLNFHIHDPAQLDMLRKWTDYVWSGYEAK